MAGPQAPATTPAPDRTQSSGDLRLTAQYLDDEFETLVLRSAADAKMGFLNNTSFNELRNYCASSVAASDDCRRRYERDILTALSNANRSLFDGFGECLTYNSRRVLALERKRIFLAKTVGGVVLMASSGTVTYVIGRYGFNSTSGWIPTAGALGAPLMFFGIIQPLLNRLLDHKNEQLGAAGQVMDVVQAANAANAIINANALNDAASRGSSFLYNTAQDCINDVEAAVVDPGEI
ncbi:hypothetical protein [Deinococcus radiotolerans]|uniref:hypothetical protein n=1 Tax=Deinococcus radiotolerans TaxID=1309407 RepID=UPI00166C504C|nr:hypothetical protein [Deinococcus radiotolerans]